MNVIPAKAGIHELADVVWIPAYAGMTKVKGTMMHCADRRLRRFPLIARR